MSSGSSLILLAMVALAFVLEGESSKMAGKSKYPVYRPKYEQTKLIFEPLVEAISNSASQSPENNEWLSNYLVRNQRNCSSYHNFEQYSAEIKHLVHLSTAGESPWSSILSVFEEASSLEGNPLHRIVLSDGSEGSKQKILLIFGEHPREFIVSESMIDFVHHMLLGYVSSSSAFSKQYVDAVLSTFELHIIPMLNPDGKQALENTQNYCWRWTGKQHQVDLNRNFDWFFAGKQGSTHKKGTEEWHGESAMSEPEAKFLANALRTQNYSVVLDIHSGTQQIFVPFVDSEARKTQRTRAETPEEVRLVEYIEKNSQGWFKDSGIAWRYNDYGADGTILDYVGGVAKVKYSLCAEIYGDPEVDNSIDCFVQFNPDTGSHFQESISLIRTLYTGTFDYFATLESKLASHMMHSAELLQQELKKMGVI